MLLGLTVVMFVGFTLADDYGISTDEPYNYAVGADAIKAYLSSANYEFYLRWGDPLAHHGSAYFMVYAGLSRLISDIYGQWQIADARHFSNFLAFLLAVGSFHFLLSRLVGKRFAWMGTLLFATQPLLFGHAFINQKDTPFMTFFLLSVAFGTLAGERLEAGIQSAPGSQLEPPAAKEAGKSSPEGGSAFRKALLLLWSGITLWILLDLWILNTLITSIVDLVNVEQVSLGLPLLSQLPGQPQLFGSPSLELGANALKWIYWLLRVPITLILLGTLILLLQATYPEVFRRFWAWFKRGAWAVLLTGLALGGTIAIRPIGAFAFALIALFWLLTLRLKAIVPILMASVTAVIAAYMTWPFLWDTPLLRFWESLGFTSSFPTRTVLYHGALLSSTQLPWHYFPKLTSIKLTEPAILLFLIGLIALLVGALRKQIDWKLILVIALWLLVPSLALWLLNFGVYDNLRQLLFLLAPILLIAGAGLSWLMNKLPRRWIQAILFLLILTPGILGILQLHPYEYTYFNTFIGSLGGTRGKYHNDYWCTSMREAIQFLNHEAQPGDLVIVRGSIPAAEGFARSDIVFTRDEWRLEEADFVLTCDDWKPADTQRLEELYVVQRQGIPFAILYQRINAGTEGY
jgi:hypothetical protein